MNEHRESFGAQRAEGDLGDATQPLTRRERRERESALSETVTYVPPVVETVTPESVAPSFDSMLTEPVTSVATFAPTAPTAPRSRWRFSRTVVLRKPGQRVASSGFVPRANRALRHIAKGSLSGALRGLGVAAITALIATLVLPTSGFNTDTPGFANVPVGLDQQFVTAEGSDFAAAINLGVFSVSNYGNIYGSQYWQGDRSYTVNYSGPIRFPFPYFVKITDTFGHRLAPCTTCRSMHSGTDFDEDEGAPVYAVADGVVTGVHHDGSLGNWVLIHHDVNGLQFDSLYAHLENNSIDFTVGQEVKVADYVGKVGSTGLSTGSHLHLEIHVDGVPVDPLAWLKKNTK